MAKESSVPCGEMECRISFSDGTSKILVPEWVPQRVVVPSKFWSLIQKASEFVASDPNRIIHSFKVGVALCLVSIFYYMRPLYEGVGGNAMWAVFTAVVAFEYTVGATVCKCLNRAAATIVAGALGIGVHLIADQLGEKFEPIILQASVFLLASAATFSRFIPSVKAQFDHGALIFILTFILVSVSGYRVEELFEMANHRLNTVGIGTSICIIISMFICPIWAGNELHNLVINNMAMLAASLDGCVAEYFINDANANEHMLGYTEALNSRANEESLINFARWEPAHGSFNFGHPWKEYLHLGDLIRSCAYSLDALHGITTSDTKTPDFMKQQFSKHCIKLGSNASAVLKELVTVTNTMAKSPKMDLRVEEMLDAVEEVRVALQAHAKKQTESKSEDSGEGKEESNASPRIAAFVESIPLVTLSSLLIEIAARTEKIVKAVNGLVNKANN